MAVGVRPGSGDTAVEDRRHDPILAPAPPTDERGSPRQAAGGFSAEDQRFLEEGAGRAAALLRAVGNEHRLLVLCLLIQQGETSVGALHQYLPSLSQSALSQHLARMREEGLVVFRREAQTLYYRIGNPQVEQLVGTLKSMFCP